MKKRNLWIAAGILFLLSGCGNSGSGQQTPSAAVAVSDGETAGTAAAESSVAADAAEESGIPYVLSKKTLKDGSMTEYWYDEAGHLAEEDFWTEGELWEIVTYENTVHEDGSYDAVTTIESLKSISIKDPQEFAYDAAGNLLRRTDYSNQSVSRQYEYTYNSDNLVTRQVRQDSQGKRPYTDYEYDAQGNLIKESIYDSDGTLQETRTYEYDEHNKCTRMHVFDQNGQEPNQYEEMRWETKTDAAGRIMEEMMVGIEHGGKTEEYSYTYDDAGNMIEKNAKSEKTVYNYAPLSEVLLTAKKN